MAFELELNNRFGPACATIRLADSELCISCSLQQDMITYLPLDQGCVLLNSLLASPHGADMTIYKYRSGIGDEVRVKRDDGEIGFLLDTTSRGGKAFLFWPTGFSDAVAKLLALTQKAVKREPLRFGL